MTTAIPMLRSVQRVRLNVGETPEWHKAPSVTSHRRLLWISPSSNVDTPWTTQVSNSRGFFMPLGLLTAVSYFPQTWEHRIHDEDTDGLVTEDLLVWADVVCFTGMYVVAKRVNDLAVRARRLGKLTVAGGPAVTLGPHRFPELDVLHIGELGDASHALIRRLDEGLERPQAQLRFSTRQAFAINDEPLPAYERLDFQKYMTCAVQYSKGCPFNCEFCDVIEIFGRVPQTKSPARFLRELDLVYGLGWRGHVMCVTDNFHGNHREAREVLVAMARWQAEHDYPFRFAAAATIDVAEHPDILEKYSKAGFHMLGVGIESAEVQTLLHTQKKQNTRRPIVESIEIIHRHGIEVAAGLIVGFDTDNENSGKAIAEMLRQARLPVASLGKLVALDGTQLHRRMAKEGRLTSEFPYMRYKQGEALVDRIYKDACSYIYDPSTVFERWAHHVAHVRPNVPSAARMTRGRAIRVLRRDLKLRLGLSRPLVKDSQGRTIPFRAPVSRLGMAARLLTSTFWTLGFRSKHRHAFWKFMGVCVQHRDLVSALAAPTMVVMSPQGKQTKSPSPMALPPTLEDEPRPSPLEAPAVHTAAV